MENHNPDEIRVRLTHQREYPVFIGFNILKNERLLQSYVFGQQVLIVTNEKLASLYLAYLEIAFKEKQCDTVILEDGELFKNQHSLSIIYDKLLKGNHHRDTTLIALGGGVIGDITGFAAATYQRGVRYLQVPTSLLAQIDASIGGKTGINHRLGKNMIGCFYQPEAVFIDLTTLNTLPLRELRAAFAEVIKYALLVGGEFFQRVYSVLGSGVIENSSQANLADIVRVCCSIKVDFIHKDEYDRCGQRALLNLGHTFAHALEVCTGYTRWLHGEAVAIGLYCASLLSYFCGNLDKKTVQLVDDMLAFAGLPRRIPVEMDLNAIYAALFQDKKIKQGKLCFVLIKEIGNCYLHEDISESLVWSSLKTALENRSFMS